MKIFKKASCLAAGVVLSVSILAGCGASDLNAAVLNINGQDVSGAELRYFLNNYQAMYDSGDSSYWETNSDQFVSVKTQATQDVIYGYAIRELAKQEGVELTDEEKQSIEDNVSALKANYDSEEALEEALEQSHLTLDVYRSQQEISLLNERLFEKFYGEKTIEIIDDKRWYCTKHILVKFADENASKHTEEKEAAEKLLKRAQSGEDFDTLIEEYGEDPGMSQSPQGYYLDANGQTPDGSSFVTEYTEASKSLEIGEISGLVESSYGYHIIKRLPLDMEYIKENVSQFAPDDFNEEYTAKLTDLMNQMDIEYTNAYKKITYKTYQ